MEHFFHIRTSNIEGGGESIIPFRFNNVQEIYYEWLCKKYLKPSGRRLRFQGVREVMMKSRQFGGSTLIQGIIAHDTMTFKGTESHIYCQDSEFSSRMLEKPKLFHEMMPEKFRPKTTKNNTKRMVFTNGSSINTGTPGVGKQKARKAGRSLNLRNLHASEVSDWPNAATTMTGLTESIPSNGNAWIEFSPRTAGDYCHNMFLKGKPGVRNRVWTSRFFPWYWFENYQRHPIQDGITSEEFISTITPEEYEVKEKYNLSIPQLYWRRRKIAEKGFDLFTFLQEYPEDEEGCLESVGQVIFPEEVRFSDGCPQRDAIPGHVHAIGVDTALGDDSGSESAIYVIDVNTMEQIYSWSNPIDPEELAYLVYEVWLKYPGLVGVEVNNMGLVTVKTLQKISDINDPFPGFLYADNSSGGFSTNKKSKSLGIFMLKRGLLKNANGMPGLKLSCPKVCYQMKFFQRLPDGSMGVPGQKVEGKELRDDCIMALMIAYAIIEHIPDIATLFEQRFGSLSGYNQNNYESKSNLIILPHMHYQGDT